MSTAFERLHPAVGFHIVNSLGWRSLRPLQEAAIGPVLDGCHALLGAPTAGGKTEAAVFPLLSRTVAERWSPLSVLYVCPLRALLNNLAPRLEGYCQLLGRRAALWHGDVGPADRRRILRDPPDVLLTTPESIEAMLMSPSVDAQRLFGGVRAVVVDEIHAFAGDDRGWHLLAMLARLDALAGTEIQRIGLTATVGNPDRLLDWLVCGGTNDRRVVMTEQTEDVELDLQVDWVASVENAARVIAALHHGEKRLVFADSRARVEELASALRAEGTTVFVSHSSLSRDVRQAAERAFAEAQDCVIVATSTLELGIDVGDLDRVIQVGAPRTVASLLQRMGRTGRRPGTARNCLFLATTDMELLLATALVSLIRQGWVEPLVPPPQPAHLLAQQLLARVLADGRVGRSSWPGPLERVAAEAGLHPRLSHVVLDWMVQREVLIEDHGIVSIGPVGESEYGRRNFMDVLSLFLSEPLLVARWGLREIGSIDPSSLASRDDARPVILLAGRPWGVRHIDWDRRIVSVEPVEEPGRSRWGGPGVALSIEVCHAIRQLVAGSQASDDCLTSRGARKLAEIRDELSWAKDGHTTLARSTRRGRTRWWTFGGARANRTLAAALDVAGVATSAVDDLGIGLRSHISLDELVQSIAAIDPMAASAPVDVRRLDSVKFSSCLPDDEVERMLVERDRDSSAVARVVSEPVALDVR